MVVAAAAAMVVARERVSARVSASASLRVIPRVRVTVRVIACINRSAVAKTLTVVREEAIGCTSVGAIKPSITKTRKPDGEVAGGISVGRTRLPDRRMPRERVRFSEDPPEVIEFAVDSGLARKVSRGYRSVRRTGLGVSAGLRSGGAPLGTTGGMKARTSTGKVGEMRTPHDGIPVEAIGGGEASFSVLSEKQNTLDSFVSFLFGDCYFGDYSCIPCSGNML